MKRSIASMACLFALALPGLAAGQSKREVEPRRELITFGEVTVEGGVTRPGIDYLLTPKAPKFANRIKLRASFLPELERSPDSL